MSYTPATFDDPKPDQFTQVKKKRIWPWIVIPVGCLSVLLVCCGGILAIGFGVMTALKSTEPFLIGLERAQKNETVREALGEPINPTMVVQGSVKLQNNDGEAELTFPVVGSKGAGQVHVQGTKKDGVWTYEDISIVLEDGGKTIDLSDEQPRR